ncbi:MAG: glycosyltransferase family 2 protein [Planctomycetales bacterium]
MKIVLPMAGRGSRFAGAEPSLPKPLIDVAGRPMVAWALESIQHVPCDQLVVVALAEHQHQFHVGEIIKSFSPVEPQLVLLDDVTEGQLCTVMAARQWIDCDEDILVMSSDTFVLSDLAGDINRQSDCRGLVSVADMPGERWSFARTDEAGRVVEVAEKRRISDHASTGMYYFSCGRDFVTCADEILNNGEKTKNEYYVIPVYQKFIQRGWPVGISVAQQMWDMGTPEALAAVTERLGQTASYESTVSLQRIAAADCAPSRGVVFPKVGLGK